MRTKTKNKGPITAQTSKKSLSRVIFSVIWGQKKWLAWIVIFLSVFFVLDRFGLPPTMDASQKPTLFSKEEVSQILFDPESLNQEDRTKSENGFLGGPMVLGTLIGSTAQASIDFSADDAMEENDLLLFQDNCLVSCTNPSGLINFPEYNREVVTYIVKQGDAPERIAASFNINTDTLLWANNLAETDIIKPGQELIILPINGVRIKIDKKDTVESLAKKYSGVAMEIIAFNDLPLEGTLIPGEYLIIPGGETPAPPKPKYVAPAKKYAGSTTPASNWLIYPASGYVWGRVHASNGVDIADNCGTPIYAAAGGKVVLSDGVGYNGGYGKYIKIQHPNGVITLYAHATKLLVGEGEAVGQGQVIALMGTTGRSTGCHLHFEVRGASNPLAGKVRTIK